MYSKGDKIKILTGPYKDMEAVVTNVEYFNTNEYVDFEIKFSSGAIPNEFRLLAEKVEKIG